MLDIIIRDYHANDLPRLMEIERSATALLAEHGFPELLGTPSPLVCEFEASLINRGVWVVARVQDDFALGYAVASDLDGVLWLYEMSVDPLFGQRGLGRTLLHAVIDHAKWAFYNAVGLSIFRNVPFNQPFYEKFGFLSADIKAAPKSIQAQFEYETPNGIDVTERVFMIRKL